MTLKSFAPSTLPSQKINATTTSGATTVPLDQYSTAVRVVNAGPNSARIKFSGPTGAGLPATGTDMLMLPNTTEVFTTGAATFAAALTDTGTAALEFCNGEGF